MSQAVCPPPADAFEFDSPEATAGSTRASIQSRWQNSPRIDVHYDRGYPVLDLGTKEIWDGSDLCLLRDTLVDLCQGGGGGGQGACQAVGIEMKSVKGIPTGFFGMLHDLHVDLSNRRASLFAPAERLCDVVVSDVLRVGGVWWISDAP